MNIRTQLSILAFVLLAGGGLLLQSCTGPTFDLKPTATGGGAPCGLGTSYKGEITLGGDSSGVAEGTTAGGTDVLVHGECDGPVSSVDAVYRLNVTDVIWIYVSICTDFDGFSYSIWRGCPSEGNLVDCDGGPSSCNSLEYGCLEPGTYYLAIEGYEEVDEAEWVATTGSFGIEYETGFCD